MTTAASAAVVAASAWFCVAQRSRFPYRLPQRSSAKSQDLHDRQRVDSRRHHRLGDRDVFVVHRPAVLTGTKRDGLDARLPESNGVVERVLAIHAGLATHQTPVY